MQIYDTCMHAYMGTYMHTYMHIHTYTHTCIYIHAYIHTYTQAIAQYELVLAQNSEDILVRFLKAQSLYARGRVNESVDEYEGVLDRHPMHCEARCVFGMLCMNARMHVCKVKGTSLVML